MRKTPLRPRGSTRWEDVSDKSFAVEVSFLERQMSMADEPMRIWLRGLLERFKEFSRELKGA